MKSLQLANLAESIRGDAIDSLSRVCEEYQLEYTITEETMTVRLPKYDEVELPIVTKLEVPEEDK